jgi:hypothetical protein
MEQAHSNFYRPDVAALVNAACTLCGLAGPGNDLVE